MAFSIVSFRFFFSVQPKLLKSSASTTRAVRTDFAITLKIADGHVLLQG